MKMITISREFGSGGRELGKRLADILGYDYYDREIIEMISKEKDLDSSFVEKSLESGAWRAAPLTFRHSFTGVSQVQAIQTNLLLEQKKVIEGIAKLNRNCVIVGRNADILLAKENPFNLFVCADAESKIKRCMERAESRISEKEILKHMKNIDKNRAKTREILSDGKWGERENYHLIVNTSGWNIKELTPAVADFAQYRFEKGIK